MKRQPCHLEVEDVETVDRRCDTRPREDETPRKHVSGDKMTITKYNDTKQEKTERRKHPKDVDIGRIVIEEIPEEKERAPTKKAPRDTQVTISRKEVKDVSKPRDETIRVGRLDLRDVEKEILESRKTKETLITHSERIDRSRKFVTDQHIAGDTKIDVIDERVQMDTRPKDQTYVGIQKAAEPCLITDKIDGGQKVDEKPEKKIFDPTLGKLA